MSNTEYQYIRRSFSINNMKIPYVCNAEISHTPAFADMYQISYEPPQISTEVSITCRFPSDKEYHDFLTTLYFHEPVLITLFENKECRAEVTVFFKGHRMEFQEFGAIDVTFEFECKEDIYEKYDQKYPHVCFGCKKPLKFGEYKQANSKMSLEQLKKLWKDKRIKLYCCGCYKMESLK